MFFLLILILVLMIASLPSVAAITNDNPRSAEQNYYIKSQYAGNIGLLSAGIGKEFLNHKLSADLSYGYLPPFVNGAQVHTIALKSTYIFKKLRYSNVVADIYYGASLNYGITHNTYLNFPGPIPNGYYVQNAVIIAPLVGIRTNIINQNKGFKNISIYAELGTVDYKIWYALKNSNICLFEIWNVCFGSIFYLF